MLLSLLFCFVLFFDSDVHLLFLQNQVILPPVLNINSIADRTPPLFAFSLNSNLMLLHLGNRIIASQLELLTGFFTSYNPFAAPLLDHRHHDHSTLRNMMWTGFGGVLSRRSEGYKAEPIM